MAFEIVSQRTQGSRRTRELAHCIARTMVQSRVGLQHVVRRIQRRLGRSQRVDRLRCDFGIQLFEENVGVAQRLSCVVADPFKRNLVKLGEKTRKSCPLSPLAGLPEAHCLHF